MKYEIINRIEVLDSGELLLGLEGQGDLGYQHVYRAAAGVYWDSLLNGFKSTRVKGWSCVQWVEQIVSTLEAELGVGVVLSEVVNWSGVPETEIALLQKKYAK